MKSKALLRLPNSAHPWELRKTTGQLSVLIALCAWLPSASVAQAATNIFFTGSQTATLVVSNLNSVTLQSGDYRFTYSADGYWSSGGGAPTGRFFSITCE